MKAIYYDWRDRKQRPSFAATIICVAVVVCAALYALAVGIEHLAWTVSGNNESQDEIGILNWLDFLYFLSYVKVSCYG